MSALILSPPSTLYSQLISMKSMCIGSVPMCEPIHVNETGEKNNVSYSGDRTYIHNTHYMHRWRGAQCTHYFPPLYTNGFQYM